jgi:1-acyl-sn-glycerol-3-phosphate acyltransferase
MIHPIIIKVVNALPSSIIRPVSKMIVSKLLNKYADITVENEEVINNIKGPVLFVGNHISNSDGLVLDKVLKKVSPSFVAGVKLSKTSLSRIGLEAVKTIPINPGSADIEAMKTCIEKVKAGESILIFPEGTRSRNSALLEGKKGVILIAKKCKVPIIPIGITGTEKLMPINDKDMGSENIYHADVRVKIGEPFYLPEKENEEDKENYNLRCMNTIMGNISKLLPDKYKGIYK